MMGIQQSGHGSNVIARELKIWEFSSKLYETNEKENQFISINGQEWHLPYSLCLNENYARINTVLDIYFVLLFPHKQEPARAVFLYFLKSFYKKKKKKKFPVVTNLSQQQTKQCNTSQHLATGLGWPNARSMLHPTMLRYVAIVWPQGLYAVSGYTVTLLRVLLTTLFPQSLKGESKST